MVNRFSEKVYPQYGILVRLMYGIFVCCQYALFYSDMSNFEVQTEVFLQFGFNCWLLIILAPMATNLAPFHNLPINMYKPHFYFFDIVIFRSVKKFQRGYREFTWSLISRGYIHKFKKKTSKRARFAARS